MLLQMCKRRYWSDCLRKGNRMFRKRSEDEDKTWNGICEDVECQGRVSRVPVNEHFTINGYSYGYAEVNGKIQMVRQSGHDEWESLVE